MQRAASSVEMDYFDKRMALEVIEDAFTTLDTAEGRWLAIGLCGAFYMCGFLSHAEWEALIERIPEDGGEGSERRVMAH